jgi:hypothetical protein
MRPVACDIRHEVVGRIADLIDKLLGDNAGRHEPARPDGFGHDEGAVLGHLCDRKSDIIPSGNPLPIGVVAAGRLGAALDQMADERAGRQPIKVINRPFELVDQRPERQGAVDATSSDDHVCAAIERSRDGKGSEIGIGAEQPAGQRRSREHLGDAGRTQAFHLRHEVVARDHGDREGKTLRLRELAERARVVGRDVVVFNNGRALIAK